MGQIRITLDEQTAARAVLCVEDHVRRLTQEVVNARVKATSAPTAEIRQARDHDARRLEAAMARAEEHARAFRDAIDAAERLEEVPV